MGKPGQSELWSPITEYIGGEERTRGSETSQYPKEEKSKRDSLSSGERTGNRPNQGTSVFWGCRAFIRDLRLDSRTSLERETTVGDSPVDEIE